MSKAFDLTKAQEAKVTFVLDKAGITNTPPLRVVGLLDVSGSTEFSQNRFYSSGLMEAVFGKLLGIAMKFDDNGEIDMFAFDDSVHELPGATAEDFGTYVTKNITRHFNSKFNGGTDWGKALQASVDFLYQPVKKGLGGLFGGKGGAVNNSPALVLMFTDGDAPKADAARVLAATEQSGKSVYFNLIGIGTGSRDGFQALQDLADKYDNCGFVAIPDIRVDDETLLTKLLGTAEFLQFIRKYGAK